MMEVVLRHRREKLARERAALAGHAPDRIGVMAVRTVTEEKK